VVPAAAGGGPDTLARLIQGIVPEEKLISQPIVVSNKPGSNHTLAWNHLQQ
jgi:tripartite-type tricarboxylate transporter receptor subunit TctC